MAIVSSAFRVLTVTPDITLSLPAVIPAVEGMLKAVEKPEGHARPGE
jgi:hypothetical protein